MTDTIKIPRGAPIGLVFAIDALADGFDPSVASVSAVIKSALRLSAPPKADPALLTLAGTYSAASGADPASWAFLHPAEDSPQLAADTYVVDFRIEVGGVVLDISWPLLIEITESVSGL